MKPKDKFINAYEVSYKEMLNSNINANHRANNKNNKRDVVDRDTFENKKDHFDPAKWFD